MSDPNLDELVQQVVEITGATEAEAKHYLGACANDIATAVELYFAQGGGSEDGSAAAAQSVAEPVDNEADEVRAPIAPIREQLIGADEDNFYSVMPARVPISTAQRVKMCPLRDFAREGELMEQQLQAAAIASSDGAGVPADNNGDPSNMSGRRQVRALNMVLSAQATPHVRPNTSRLGDLFRPPTDIAFPGTFQAARKRATDLRLWLLVNVQSDNFDSQLLNRDVWSDKELRRLISRQFVLWQINSESIEGRRFITFYHCAKLPYVCLIDPRTGEEVWRSAEPKQSTLLAELRQFLADHKDFEKEFNEDLPSTSKRPTECISIDDDDDEPGFSTGSKMHRPMLMELSEEEQIALAIRNSMSENGGAHKKQKATATATRSTADVVDLDGDDDGAEESSGNRIKRAKLMKYNEDEHIQMGIRHTMRKNGGGRKAVATATATATRSTMDDDVNDGINAAGGNDGSNAGSVEEFDTEDTKSACKCIAYDHQLGAAKDELTTLKVRLLNAAGVVEMVTLRWPSDTRLHVIHQYIAQQHVHIPKHGYKLICAFPRKTLEAEHNASSLKELGLHPSANLHVTLND